MTPTRIVALATLALIAGCSKPPRPKVAANDEKSPDQSQSASPVLAIPAAPPTPSGNPTADATAAAKTFLKAVRDGTATPAVLTPAFKKVIAEPVFADDQAKGYSDAAAFSRCAIIHHRDLDELKASGRSAARGTP